MPIFAMEREFLEETQLTANRFSWAYFAQLHSSNFQVFCYTCRVTEARLKWAVEVIKDNEEPCKLVILTDLITHQKVIDNLIWLVYLAKDVLEDKRPLIVSVKYPN